MHGSKLGDIIRGLEMDFKPAASLTEQIADHLTREIISGRLRPHERIQELKVARELGVSRGSVREALLILEGRHLIEIVPRRGAVVSAFDAGDRAALAQLLAELWSFTFREAAERGADEATPPLDAALARMDEAVRAGRNEDVIGAKYEFIDAGVPLAENRYLTTVIRGILPAAERLSVAASQRPGFDARDTLRFARALREAVAAKDRGRIDELIHAHCRRETMLAGEGGARP